MTPFATESDEARRSDMFSPILAMVSPMASASVISPTLAALIFSTSVPTFSATFAIILTRPWNRSLRATKSVSEFTSTTTPLDPSTATPMRPSAAMRPAFLAALASPRLRSKSTACSISPPVSCSAVLQSIMPAPVRSRSSLTICAVMLAISKIPCPLRVRQHKRCFESHSSEQHALGCVARLTVTRPARTKPGMTALLCAQLFRLRDPAFHPAGQSNFLADLAGSVGAEPCNLPIVEDPEIVELLLDGGRYMVKFREIVGDAARAGQHLVAGPLGGRGQLFHDRFGRGARVDPEFALRARYAVDCCFRREIAIKRDGATGVIIAGHDEGDAVGVAVGVDHGGDWQTQTPRLLNRDVLLVGIDHEQQVGKTAHVLDAAERSVELVALALQRQALFLGVARGLP